MAASDYRVSKVAVLCKDCRQDVGMYPSRHRCLAQDAPPPVPTLPTVVRESPSLAPPSLAPPRPGLSTRSNSSNSAGSGRYAARPAAAAGTGAGNSLRAGAGRWARPANTTPNSRTPSSGGGGGEESDTSNAGGGTIWGKLRAATAWNQDTAEANGSDRGEDDQENGGNTSQNSGGKFWGKLMGSSGNSEKSEDPDSDATDYEGESHVTRQLKAYYRERYPDAPLPGWLTNPPPELAGLNGRGGTHRSTPSTHSTATVSSFGRPSAHSEHSRRSQDSGHYRNSPYTATSSGFEQPSACGRDAREYGGAGDAGPGTSPVRFAAAPAPTRRPARPRVNVRRDAGAFFDQDD